MSFLPFVLSLLMILVLGSSFLFTSYRSTSLEKTVILAQNRSHLALISKQAEADFKKSEIKKPTADGKPTQTQEIKPEKEKKDKIPVYKDKRSKRSGRESSKFNLWPLLNDKNKTTSISLYKSAIKLIQILYQDVDFYKKAKDPELARKILDEMIAKKKDDFTQLFPDNPLLSEIYYKMLKGSNTGYPPLREYFKIEKTDKAPIQWAYASTPVLQAILGEEATKRILAAEKSAWEANHRTKTLTKETLRTLLQTHSNPDFDIGQLETIFLFDRREKGAPHTYVDNRNKVTATR